MQLILKLKKTLKLEFIWLATLHGLQGLTHKPVQCRSYRDHLMPRVAFAGTILAMLEQHLTAKRAFHRASARHGAT